MKITVGFRLQVKQHALLKEVARIQGETVSALAGQAIANYLVAQVPPATYEEAKRRVECDVRAESGE